jgi:tetratricopeptide (TPR) repeat protein
LSVQKWDRAAKLLTTVLEKKPDFLPALLERALAYSKLGEYDRSIQDLEKVVQINPDLPDPYGMLGVVYEIKKDYASALKVYRNALPRVKNPEVKKILDKWIADTEAKVKAKK